MKSSNLCSNSFWVDEDNKDECMYEIRCNFSTKFFLFFFVPKGFLCCINWFVGVSYLHSVTGCPWGVTETVLLTEQLRMWLNFGSDHFRAVSILTEDFHGLPSSSRWILKIGHAWFLPHPFQFTIHVQPLISLTAVYAVLLNKPRPIQVL